MDLEGDEMASTTPANSMEQQLDEVAKAFVDHYYNMFDNSRPNLPALYDSSSVMSFEGQKIEGGHNISLKLANLSFNECKHYVSTIDCQPTGVAGGIIVFVSGSLQLPGEEHYLRFSQMFHLVPTPEGSFYIHNDIFRLNYG